MRRTDGVGRSGGLAGAGRRDQEVPQVKGRVEPTLVGRGPPKSNRSAALESPERTVEFEIDPDSIWED